MIKNKIIFFSLISLLYLQLSLPSLAMFSDDQFDLNGNITVRAIVAVTDQDLDNHIPRTGAATVRAVNLVDQGLITDISLTLLAARCNNITFLNVENTGVTAQGVATFRQTFPNAEVHH